MTFFSIKQIRNVNKSSIAVLCCVAETEKEGKDLSHKIASAKETNSLTLSGLQKQLQQLLID